MKRLLNKAKSAGLVEEQVDLEAQRAETERAVDSMWHWLRTNLDEACEIYQHEGKDENLRMVLAGEALNGVREYLDTLRAKNMLLVYPKEKRNEYALRLNAQYENTYKITEYFHDWSRIERYDNHQLVETYEAGGVERVISATIVAEGENYYISSVVIVD